jgi:hypothetical protein
MITAGRDRRRSGFGMNAGMYRLMLKERNITGIAIPPNEKVCRASAAAKETATDFRFYRHASIRIGRIDVQS